MASQITLSAGVRSNLLNLQTTADLKNLTQTRLSTGKKVNSALDNPTNFFTSSALSSRSSDLTALLDGISNGIQTLKAADNGISSITSSIESLQATVRQARQDKSYQTAGAVVDTTLTTAAKNLTITGGQGVASTTIALNASVLTGAAAYNSAAIPAAGTFTLTQTTLNGGVAVSATIAATDTADQAAAKINDALGLATGGAHGVSASVANGKLVITSAFDNTNAVTVGGTATAAAEFGAGVATFAVNSADIITDAVNSNTGFTNKVRASTDNGKLRLENDSTLDLTITGYNSSTGLFDGGTGTKIVGGNAVRKNLVTQFNEVRDQLNKLADDASFNGVNLLRGDALKLTFNETSTSSITIQSKDPTGINTTSLGITAATDTEFGSDTSLDARLTQLSDSLVTLRSQSSAFGSKLSIVQNRQDFTKALTNTLQVGADNLTLADTNEEGANLLALNTRQQLQTTSLSFASQADQAVLQFLR